MPVQSIIRRRRPAAVLVFPVTIHQAATAQGSRRVEFTTTEGTRISLDVSRVDGTIAFELLGDVYTMPISGGTARPIIVGPAWASQPGYSPDGRSIYATQIEGRTADLWRYEVATSRAERVVPNGNGSPSLLVSAPAITAISSISPRAAAQSREPAWPVKQPSGPRLSPPG